LPAGTGVVGTLMSNLGLELALKARDIPFIRANVGDRYVMAEMANRGWVLGGENSGHIVCRQHTTTGDAIIAALQVVLALRRRDQRLADARQAWHKYPQILVNVRLTPGQDPTQQAELQQACDQVVEALDGRGRVLLRKSGTEPLLRIMVEGEEEAVVRHHAEALAALARSLAS